MTLGDRGEGETITRSPEELVNNYKYMCMDSNCYKYVAGGLNKQHKYKQPPHSSTHLHRNKVYIVCVLQESQDFMGWFVLLLSEEGIQED